MMTQFFSTKELSEFCAVGETTVKRWSNMGLIRHHKTVGGHRKFKLEDVLEFISKNNITVPAEKLERLTTEKKYAESLDLNSEILLVRGDLDGLGAKLLEHLLAFRKNETDALLSKAVDQGIPIAVIFDKLIAPVMHRVGELWSEKKLGVGEEHIITNILTEAILRIKARNEVDLGLAPKPDETTTTRPTDDVMSSDKFLSLYEKQASVICTCPESEYHQVGLLGASLVCQSLGFKVNYVGAAVPFKDLEHVVMEMHPTLVCMSFTIAKLSPATYRRYELFRKFLKKRGVRFIIGGQFLRETKSQQLNADFRARSCSELEQYLKENFEVGKAPQNERFAAINTVAYAS